MATSEASRLDRGSSDHLLVEVVRQLAGARAIGEIVEIVRHAARRLTGADGATFVLRDGDDCRYVDEDAIAPLWKGATFPMDACISGWAMTHRTAVTIDDIYADDRIPHDAYRPTFVRSLAMVPIRTEEPIGAIGNYWAEHHAPTGHEVELLQALADSTAVAMANVRLYAELEARVAARTADLARANDELRDLAAVVAHDIRSPLTTVAGFAHVLTTVYAEEMSPAALDAAERLHRSARSLTEFTTQLLDYLAAGASEPNIGTVAVRDLVADVVDRLAGAIQTRSATIDITGADHLTGDPVLLAQLLQNLVANAIVHVPPDRNPRVAVDLSFDDGHWELAVSDNGDGVPPDERDRIFLPFERGASARRLGGTGLGLAVCSRIALQHGGTLTVTDAPTGGAKFVVRVPTAAVTDAPDGSPATA